MANIRKVQYTFFGMLAFYMVTGIGALVLANMWLSSEAAPREAVISREIEKGTHHLPIFFTLQLASGSESVDFSAGCT